MRRREIAWFVLLGSAASLASGCSGSDRAATLPDRPAVSASPTTPAETSSIPAATKSLTKTQAGKALLTVKDMPTGYAAEEPEAKSPKPSTVSPTRCAPLVNDRRGTTLAEASFSQGGLTGAQFFEEIIQPEDGVTPRERIKAIESLLSRCPQYSVKDSDGTSTVKVSALSFPELGDYTLAVRVTAKIQGFTAHSDFIYVAVGPAFTKAATIGLADTLTGTELERVMRTAATRLESAT